jgi:SAM-dependent methyltransferase
VNHPDDIRRLAPKLQQREFGVWFAPRQGEVSYPKHGNSEYLRIEDASYWFRHRNLCLLSVMERFPPPGLLIDIGGGNGYVSLGLQRAGLSCVLLEPGLDGALAAHARGVRNVICARLEDADFEPGSFAAAGLFDVLEHIEQDSGALVSIRKLLQKNGRLFLTVPTYPLLFSADDRSAGHFRRYTVAGLSRLLASSGFEIEYSTHIFAVLPIPILLFRVFPTRLGLTDSRGEVERAAAAHRSEGLTGRLIDAALQLELRIIRRGNTVPFGSSCLVVARPA